MAVNKLFSNTSKYKGLIRNANAANADDSHSKLFDADYTPSYFSLKMLEDIENNPNNIYIHDQVFTEKTIPKNVGTNTIRFRWYKPWIQVDKDALDLKELEEPDFKTLEKDSFAFSNKVAGNLISITDIAVLEDMDNIIPQIAKALVTNRLATKDYVYRKFLADNNSEHPDGIFIGEGGKFTNTVPTSNNWDFKKVNILNNLLSISQRLSAQNANRFSWNGYYLIMPQRAYSWYFIQGDWQRSMNISAGRTIQDTINDFTKSAGLNLKILLVDDLIATTSPKNGNAKPTKANFVTEQSLVNADANIYDVFYVIAAKTLYKSETLDAKTGFGSFIYKGFADIPNGYLERYMSAGYKIMYGTAIRNAADIYAFVAPNYRSNLLT